MDLIYFFRLIRFNQICLIAASLFIIKYYFITPVINHYNTTLNQVIASSALTELEFCLLIISICCIAAAGFSINNYFDIKANSAHSLNKNPVGLNINRRISITTHVFFNIIGVVLAIYLAYSVGKIKLAFIQFAMALILWQYSVSFKKQFLIGNFMISSLVAIGVLLIPLYDLFPVILDGYRELSKEIFKVMLIYAYCLFTTTFIHEIIKDVKNKEVDKSLGFNTIAIKFGEIKTKYLAVILISSLLTLISYFLLKSDTGLMLKYYAIASIYAPLFFLIYRLFFYKSNKNYSLCLSLLKGIMCSIIGSFIILYYTSNV